MLMKKNNIGVNSFDKRLSKLLKNKRGKNVIVGRYNIENIDLSKKSVFVMKFLHSLKAVRGITYKVLYWEKNDDIKEFITNSYPNKDFIISVPYRNGKCPGELYLEDLGVEKNFLKKLLDNHFNFEMAKEPSYNLRVQICINQDEFITLLDVYDDRGFDIYMWEHQPPKKDSPKVNGKPSSAVK